MYIITGLVGLAAIAAPFVLGFTSNTAALWTNLIVGAVLITASVAEAIEQDRDNIEYRVAAIFGIGAIAAPFVLGFADHTQALWTSIGVGVVAILAAGWRLINRSVLQ